MKESKKEKRVKELLKSEEYTFEEIAKITKLPLKRVKSIASKMWKVDKEKDLEMYIILKYKLQTDIRMNIKEKYGFFK